MEMRIKPFDWIALTLVIIGAINWGLIGFFQFDLGLPVLYTLWLVSRVFIRLVYTEELKIQVWLTRRVDFDKF